MEYYETPQISKPNILNEWSIPHKRDMDTLLATIDIIRNSFVTICSLTER